MPNPKPSHRDRRRMSEKSMSFHGKGSALAGSPGQLRRPKTLPELPSASMIGGEGGVGLQVSPEGRPRLTKLLLNVTIQGSVWAVQVLMKPDSTVADLIAAALRQYSKEGRRPVLPTSEPSDFDLHYSQFSLESLNRKEKLAVLGSRNFFLCKIKAVEEKSAAGSPGNMATVAETASSSSCSKQAEKAGKTGFGLPWLKFMGFLQ